MNKKAMSETMVILLIFVLGAIILFNFSGKLSTFFKEDSDIETCRLSVLAQSQTRNIPVVNVGTPGTIVPLDCPRRILKVFEDKVEIKDKKSTKYKFKKLSEDDINNLVAEELRLCWYRMAEGKRNIFENSWIFGDPYTCLICSEIQFDDELKGKSYGGLLEYLKSRKIPKSDISYFAYLIRSQNNIHLLWGRLPWAQWTPWGYGTTDKIDKDDKINTNDKYSIYFIAYKPSFASQVTKAYTQSSYIGLKIEEKLTEECHIQVN